jgi:hypothetical protein
MWYNAKGETYTSPMHKVGGVLVHACCITTYVERKKTPEGKTMIRIHPRYSGLTRWQRFKQWVKEVVS